MSDRVDRNLDSSISIRAALGAGVVCLLALVATGLAITLLPSVRLHDISALRAFSMLATPAAKPWENRFAGIVDTGPAFLLGALLCATALARRRPRVAVLILVILVGSSASTELVKVLLAVPRHSPLLNPVQVSPHSWPSGHSTAIMSVVLCAVILAPRRARALVALLGSVLALGVAFSVLALRWHFPTDVLGGFLMSATWTCFGVAALRAIDERWPARQPQARLRPRGLAALDR